MKLKNLIGLFELSFSVLLLFPGVTHAQEFIATPSDYHGYGVSCHGGNDGSITIQMVNGLAPFMYNWTHGSTSMNLTNLTAGTYTLTVTDADFSTFTMDIELNEPLPLNLILHPRVLEGGYNISEMGGHDGLIESEVFGGATPYSYNWVGGSAESSLGNLGVGTYRLDVIDMNHCTVNASATLAPLGGMLCESQLGNVV